MRFELNNRDQIFFDLNELKNYKPNINIFWINQINLSDHYPFNDSTFVLYFGMK